MVWFILTALTQLVAVSADGGADWICGKMSISSRWGRNLLTVALSACQQRRLLDFMNNFYVLTYYNLLSLFLRQYGKSAISLWLHLSSLFSSSLSKIKWNFRTKSFKIKMLLNYTAQKNPTSDLDIMWLSSVVVCNNIWACSWWVLLPDLDQSISESSLMLW